MDNINDRQNFSKHQGHSCDGALDLRIPPKGVIFDLGDVLFTWSANTTTTIPAQMMRSILSSATWNEYECGRIEQDACYCEIAQHFSVPTLEVAEAFSQARDSLQPNKAMVSFIRELRQVQPGALEIYAMSNISKEDYQVLSKKMADWSIFSRVFTSGHVGMRKPDLSFYHHVLKEIELAPEEAVFIDDKLENVLAARSLGIKSIVFDDTSIVAHTLSSIFNYAVGRGNKYLSRNAKQFNSITECGVVVPDNFAQLLILDTTQDLDLVSVEWASKRTWNFFIGKPVLIRGGYFPDDLDTTALALTVLRPPLKVVTSLLDEMANYVNLDGTVQTYFDCKKIRTDAVVSANVLARFYSYGRGQQLEHTLQLIHDVLLHRTYINGTRYYPSPDCCLFFFGRLLRSSDDVHLMVTLGPLLEERTRERIGQTGGALDLAMRILTCSSLGLDCDIDRRALLDLQDEDGGWKTGWLYSYGSTGVKLGNWGVTTALAIKAIISLEKSNRAMYLSCGG